jgi:predicted nucleic acid-binding Zn ribbon protein
VIKKVVVDCRHCKQSFESGLKPGKMAKCKHCGEKTAVPFSADAGEETAFDCPKCQAPIKTKTSAGKKVKCSACEERVRVPLKDAGLPLSRELTCGECQHDFGTAEKPGQKLSCPACSAELRVPMTAPAITLTAVAPVKEEPAQKSLVSRSCPECGAKVRGHIQKCPDCDIDIDNAIKQKRYGGTNPQLVALDKSPVTFLNRLVAGRVGVLGSLLVSVLGVAQLLHFANLGAFEARFTILAIIMILGGIAGSLLSLARTIDGE